jgi:nucleoid-associated protein YgaU
MKVAWLLVAPTFALAVLWCGPVVAEGTRADDPVRRRAEELAVEASRKFGEVLAAPSNNEPAPARKAGPGAPRELRGERPISLLLAWLDYSEQETQGLVRQLARVPAPDPAILSWFRRSSRAFQSIMLALARGSAGRPRGAPQEEAPAPRDPGAPSPSAEEAARLAEAAAAAEMLAQWKERAEAEAQAAAELSTTTSGQAPSAAAPPPAAEARLAEAPRAEAPTPEAEAAPTAAAPEEPAPPHQEPAAPEQPPAPAPITGEAPQAGALAAAEAAHEEEPAAEQSSPAGAPQVQRQDADGPTNAAPSAPHHAPGSQVVAAAPPQPSPDQLRRVSKIATTKTLRTGNRASGCPGARTLKRLPGWYTVQRGDTLWTIARRHYGSGRRYKRIYAANRARLGRGPDWIVPCQRLYLPPQRRRR